jgi:tetratricopeptide (TPR) repeat protein
MPNKVWEKIAGAISLVMLLALPARAQDQWQWPEKPSNLQVFPKDWPGTRLRPVMIQFTTTLGVRCSYCHKGVEGKPLSTYDFASDVNPNKDRAREMLRMLTDINAHLQKIQPSGDKRVNVWCHTCHHGKPRPITLEEELMEQYRAKGVQGALDRYAELKKKYYGRDAYDFGEGSLNAVGYLLLEKDPAGSIPVFQLNAATFPQSGNVWDSLAEAYMKAGDLKKAQENYEKSLTLDPTNDNAKEMLKKIKEIKDK